jgi:hypothetical protein
MIPVPASEENASEGVLRGKDFAREMFANRHVEKVQGAVLEGMRIAANGPLVVIESRVEATSAVRTWPTTSSSSSRSRWHGRVDVRVRHVDGEGTEQQLGRPRLSPPPPPDAAVTREQPP